MNIAELKSVFLIAIAVPAQLIFTKDNFNCAQFIRAQRNNPSCVHPLQCFTGRVPVTVILSHRDYTVTWSDAVKEIRGRRCF